MSQHNVTITGYVASEPMLSRFKNGHVKLSMRVASSRRYNNGQNNNEGEWQETDQLFVAVEAWGNLALNVKQGFKKGMPVIVVGSLNTTSFVDKEGTNQTRIYVRAQHIGLDMNRYVIASRKIDAPPAPPGLSVPGDEEVPFDRDYSQDSSADTAADATAAQASQSSLEGNEADERLEADTELVGQASSAQPGPSANAFAEENEPPY